MVVTSLPSALATGTEQERCATPSMWSVQAPHNPAPQPNLVPVSPADSLITHNNGADSAPSYEKGLPFNLNLTIELSGSQCPVSLSSIRGANNAVYRVYVSARRTNGR
jgi:hypothetical protein